MTEGRIVLHAAPGQPVGDLAREAIATAEALQCSVLLSHNGTTVKVRADDTVKAVSDRWAAARGAS